MSPAARGLADLARWARWLYGTVDAPAPLRAAYYRNYEEWFEDYG